MEYLKFGLVCNLSRRGARVRVPSTPPLTELSPCFYRGFFFEVCCAHTSDHTFRLADSLERGGYSPEPHILKVRIHASETSSKMNDPHVEALYYDIGTGNNRISYGEPPAVSFDNHIGKFSLVDCKLTVELSVNRRARMTYLWG